MSMVMGPRSSAAARSQVKSFQGAVDPSRRFRSLLLITVRNDPPGPAASAGADELVAQQQRRRRCSAHERAHGDRRWCPLLRSGRWSSRCSGDFRLQESSLAVSQDTLTMRKLEAVIGVFGEQI
jgi:hypothetical protein